MIEMAFFSLYYAKETNEGGEKNPWKKPRIITLLQEGGNSDGKISKS